jgi:hypothetical protein
MSNQNTNESFAIMQEFDGLYELVTKDVSNMLAKTMVLMLRKEFPEQYSTILEKVKAKVCKEKVELAKSIGLNMTPERIDRMLDISVKAIYIDDIEFLFEFYAFIDAEYEDFKKGL